METKPPIYEGYSSKFNIEEAKKSPDLCKYFDEIRNRFSSRSAALSTPIPEL